MLKFDEKLYTLITRCIRCGECSYGNEKIEYEELCPIYKKYNFFSHSPGGIVQIARAYLEGRIKNFPSINNLIYKCSACGVCEICGIIDSPLKVGLILKNELRKKGILPPNGVKNIVKNISEIGVSIKKKFFNKNIDNSDAKLLYFTGCREKIVDKTVKILKNLNINFSVINKLNCCGLPLYLSGEFELFKKIATKNVEILNKIKPECILFTCGSCYYTFKKLYPEITGKNLEFELIYVSDFLKKNNVKINSKVKRITYHDPCKLGRGCNFYDSPREFLKNSKLELVEMKRNKENSFCCGSGNGIVKATDPKFAIEIAVERVVEAEKLNVEAIVTSCSTCIENLKRAAKITNSNLKVYHLLDILET